LFRDALRDFSDTRSDKLIVDLRGNPGGYLQAAVSNASWFLSSDQLVVREDRGDAIEGKTYYSYGYDVFPDDLKLVVLIDGGSASASEIMAAALADNNRAVLVGQNSFGKGSVQEVVNLTEKTSLKITIARWLTPNGDHISEDGIQPDVVVDELSENPDEDFILDRAVEVINETDFFNRLQ
jgi:carboxyl-terminal processing protease